MSTILLMVKTSSFKSKRVTELRVIAVIMMVTIILIIANTYSTHILCQAVF